MEPEAEARARALVAEWQKRTYYEVLGVPKDATTATIKRAYYKQAREFHPDKNEEPGAEEVFKMINEAYQVLMDEGKRATYDKYGKAGVQQADGGGGGDPIDLMKMMFGGEAYADTFGDLNMWETIKIQMMVSAGAQLTEQMVQERLQQFAMERHAKLVKALIMKLEPFVISDLERFKKNVEADVADKAAAPGGVSLMGVIGYVYCQVAQQFMDRFLGLGSVFAKVAEKGHRFKNNMSALGAAVKLTYSAVKLQQKMELEEQQKMQKWAVDHPGVPYPGTVSYETYDFDADERWLTYKRNVEVPEGADKEAAMEKVRHKWYANNIEVHHVAFMEAEEKRAEGEEDPMAGQNGEDMKRMMDQGLKLMWKLGVMEAEEICREVCREICDPRSEWNTTNKTSKDELKRRVLGIHHMGEKFKAVAAKLKKEEKKAGFSFDEFLAKEGDAPADGVKSPRSPRGNARPTGAPDTATDPAASAAAEPVADVAPPLVKKADDID